MAPPPAAAVAPDRELIIAIQGQTQTLDKFSLERVINPAQKSSRRPDFSLIDHVRTLEVAEAAYQSAAADRFVARGSKMS